MPSAAKTASVNRVHIAGRRVHQRVALSRWQAETEFNA